MKVIIAGGRDIIYKEIVEKAIKESGFVITELISGACPTGVDVLGEKWAKENGIKIIRYPANWDKYGRAAGPIRNEQMSEIAEALIAIWDGKSPGTKNMISNATKKN